MSIEIKLKRRISAMKQLKEDLHAAAKRGVTLRKLQLINLLEAATPVDTGKAREGWKTTQTGLSNTVEYIDELNRGHSKQAPSHFIEKTLLSQRDVIPSGIIVRHK